MGFLQRAGSTYITTIHLDVIAQRRLTLLLNKYHTQGNAQQTINLRLGVPVGSSAQLALDVLVSEARRLGARIGYLAAEARLLTLPRRESQLARSDRLPRGRSIRQRNSVPQYLHGQF